MQEKLLVEAFKTSNGSCFNEPFAFVHKYFRFLVNIGSIFLWFWLKKAKNLSNMRKISDISQNTPKLDLKNWSEQRLKIDDNTDHNMPEIKNLEKD